MRNRLNQGKVVQTWGYNFKNIRNATDLNTIMPLSNKQYFLYSTNFQNIFEMGRALSLLY